MMQIHDHVELSGFRLSLRLMVAALSGMAVVANCRAEEPPARAADVALTAPERLEPGQSLSAHLTIRNNSDAPVSWKVSYCLQADSAMFNREPPDPVYGSDRALGARSWTEADGKIIEEGSLT